MKKQIQQLRMANCRLKNKVTVLENMAAVKVHKKTVSFVNAHKANITNFNMKVS